MYALLLASIVIVSLATTAAVPPWSTVVQREKEAELTFRLTQYRTAIARYRADHNRYPQKLEELLIDASQLQRRRYLRRLYPDPMTGKADWTLDIVRDQTGAVSGIKDLHSRSRARSFRALGGKATYSEW